MDFVQKKAKKISSIHIWKSLERNLLGFTVPWMIYEIFFISLTRLLQQLSSAHVPLDLTPWLRFIFVTVCLGKQFAWRVFLKNFNDFLSFRNFWTVRKIKKFQRISVQKLDELLHGTLLYQHCKLCFLQYVCKSRSLEENFWIFHGLQNFRNFVFSKNIKI